MRTKANKALTHLKDEWEERNYSKTILFIIDRELGRLIIVDYKISYFYQEENNGSAVNRLSSSDRQINEYRDSSVADLNVRQMLERDNGTAECRNWEAMWPFHFTWVLRLLKDHLILWETKFSFLYKFKIKNKLFNVLYSNMIYKALNVKFVLI